MWAPLLIHKVFSSRSSVCIPSCTLNVWRESTPSNSTALRKRRGKTLTNKHETTLNFECPTGISHLQLGRTRWGQTLTGTALAIITTTDLGGMAYSKGTDFGRREQNVSRVGAAATSSVRSFQSLTALGKRRISCSQYDTWQDITGNGNDGLLWYWDSHLVFTWCQWLWSHGDGGTYKSSPVLLSCTYVGDMVSLVLSACCWHWISCSISVVSTMLPFAVQTLGSWSGWCCVGAR